MFYTLHLNTGGFPFWQLHEVLKIFSDAATVSVYAVPVSFGHTDPQFELVPQLVMYVLLVRVAKDAPTNRIFFIINYIFSKRSSLPL